MPSVSVRSIPRGDDLDLQRGETWSILFYRLGDISGRDELWFTLKDDTIKDDDDALVKISEGTGLEVIDGTVATVAANGSITVIDAVVGDAEVKLAPIEAAKLDNVGNWYYDVQMYDDPDTITLVSGRAVLMGDVTRDTS